jgi:hypothetical protein
LLLVPRVAQALAKKRANRRRPLDEKAGKSQKKRPSDKRRSRVSRR